MEAQFWHDKWASGKLGFHERAVNPWLAKYIDRLELTPGQTVFVPLCGKTVDVPWLLAKGFRVVGCELVESAIQALFSENDIRPEVDTVNAMKRYRAPMLEIYVGDFFDLDAQTLGGVHAIWDRAALVALPADTRPKYAHHMAAVSECAQQLLVTFNYDQNVTEGPPFSLNRDDVVGYYGDVYVVEELQRSELEGGLKGWVPTVEEIWRLTAKIEKGS
ncbi:MAG: thiopurine S-methyltransferase [Pseudomonadota bacterium]